MRDDRSLKALCDNLVDRAESIWVVVEAPDEHGVSRTAGGDIKLRAVVVEK